MKKWVLAATAAAMGFAGSASAAVITLDAISTNGPGDFTWTYQGTLGPDEGVRSGDRLIIYDFGGYIDGSIFSPSPDLVASVEYSSPSGMVTPGFDDDASIANLVFTYVGADFQNQGGPYAPFSFDGLGARSEFSGQVQDAFFTLTTKNNPDNRPGGANTPVYTLGDITVPAAVPEPATWAMLMGGFGLIGMASRRRSTTVRVTA